MTEYHLPGYVVETSVVSLVAGVITFWFPGTLVQSCIVGLIVGVIAYWFLQKWKYKPPPPATIAFPPTGDSNPTVQETVGRDLFAISTDKNKPTERMDISKEEPDMQEIADSDRTAGVTDNIKCVRVKYIDYSKLCILVSKCSAMLMRAFVMKYVQESTPKDFVPNPWTLDDLLLENQEVIFKRNIYPKQEVILFPLGKKNTNIEKWDLTLLSLILIEVCKPSRQLENDIRQILKLRNNLCHIADPNISQEKYNIYLNKFKVIIQRCLTELHIDAFAKEINEIVRDVESGRLITDDPLQDLKEWITNDYKQDSLQPKLKEEIQKFVMNLEDLRNQRCKPETGLLTKITLTVENCHSEQETHISKLFVAFLEKRLNDEFPNTLVEDVETLSKRDIEILKQVFDECLTAILSGDRELDNSEIGCVIMNIRCPSVKSASNLWMECAYGEVTQLFYPVQCLLRQFEGFENITVTALVTETEVWRCMNKLVLDMSTSIGLYNENSQEHEHSDSNIVVGASILERSEDEEMDGTQIQLIIKPRSFRQLEHVLNVCKSGELNRNLSKVSDTVQDILNVRDFTIKATFDEEEITRVLKESVYETGVEGPSGVIGANDDGAEYCYISTESVCDEDNIDLQGRLKLTDNKSDVTEWKKVRLETINALRELATQIDSNKQRRRFANITVGAVGISTAILDGVLAGGLPIISAIVGAIGITTSIGLWAHWNSVLKHVQEIIENDRRVTQTLIDNSTKLGDRMVIRGSSVTNVMEKESLEILSRISQAAEVERAASKASGEASVILGVILLPFSIHELVSNSIHKKKPHEDAEHIKKFANVLEIELNNVTKSM